MRIYEVQTKNGRLFRVAIANDNQEKRFLKLVEDNKKKSSYEQFVIIKKDILKGVHDLKEFEALCNTLQ